MKHTSETLKLKTDIRKASVEPHGKTHCMVCAYSTKPVYTFNIAHERNNTSGSGWGTPWICKVCWIALSEHIVKEMALTNEEENNE